MNFEDQGLRSYQASLTPFAFQYVEQQFGLSDKVKLTDNKDGATAIVSFKGCEFATGIDDCPCGSFRAMELPCRHILAVRNLLGINTFSLELFSSRWHLENFTSHHHAYRHSTQSSDTTAHVEVDIQEDIQIASQVMTEQQKYAKGFKVAQAVAQHLSHMGTDTFKYNFKSLKSFRDMIAQGKRALVTECGDGK